MTNPDDYHSQYEDRIFNGIRWTVRFLALAGGVALALLLMGLVRLLIG